MRNKNKNYVVIGNSAAGISCIEAIREEDNNSKIINVSRETSRPYSRCLLSYYLAGSIDRDKMWIRPESFYKDLKVKPLLNMEVISIDEKNRKLKLTDKKEINYDKLLFGTGASAKKADIKGIEKKGVFYLRTIDDADGILSMLEEVKDVVILGGGLIGLRAAHSLKKRNKNIHVIVKSSHILSQVIDDESADMVRQHLQANGINIYTGLAAKEILGRDKVNGILLDDGKKIDCGLVIIGKGVSSNIELLKNKVKTNWGILVDECLATSDKSIYAAGDVAETFDVFEEKSNINAVWPTAIRQGRIAGFNMAGKITVYEGSCGMNSIDFFGMSVISSGIFKPPKEGFEELIQANFSENAYRKVVLRNNKIVGTVFVNDVERHGVILHLALNKIDISDIKDILVDEYFDYGKVIPLIKRQKEKFIRPEYQDSSLTYEPSFYKF